MRTRYLRYMVALSALCAAGCEGLTIQDTQSLLAPHFTRSEVLGFIAGFGTTFAALPDLIAMIRRRSIDNMNPRMCAIIGSFQILWIWYGLIIASRPVVLWNVMGVLINLFTVATYYYFARRKPVK